MIKLFKSGLYFLLILLISSANARDLRVKQISKEIEIPSEFITHVAQLNNGYLLVSTANGTRLFDGYQFIPVLPSVTSGHSPLDTHVYKTLEDNRGTIWFATALGLYHLNKGSNKLAKLAHQPNNPNSLINDNVRDILLDSNGNLWFATLDGISHYIPSTGQFKNYNQIESQSDIDQPLGRIYVLLEEKDKFIWIGSASGLFYIDLATDKLFKMGGVLEKSYITSAIHTQNNEIWFGADNAGIYKLNLQNREFELLNKNSVTGLKLKSNNVWALYLAPSGLIWVGYWESGVSVFNPATQENDQINYRLYDVNGLPSSAIQQIIPDRSGLIWFATSKGLASFNAAAFKLDSLRHIAGEENTLDNSAIISVIEDKQGLVWIGTEKGLQSWDPKTNNIQHSKDIKNIPASLSDNSIWMIEEVDNNHLLLATNKGILLFDKTAQQMTSFKPFKARDGEPLNVAFYALAKGENNWFYVASSAATIHLFNPLTDERKLVFDSMSNPLTHEVEYFQVILPLKDGSLWLGSTTGLYFFNIKTEEVTVYSATSEHNSLSGNVINDLYLDDNNLLWVATSTGGLNLIDTTSGTISYISDKQQLPANDILSLVAGKNNNLWFTSGKHFGSINRSTKKVELFPMLSGKNESFAAGTSFLGESGNLYLGGERLYRFDPATFKEAQYLPEVRVTGISTQHQPMTTFSPLNELQVVDIYPMDSLVTFNFSSLDYAYPEFNRYRYKLEGVDREWLSPETIHQATYSHLPAGQFNLLIQGTNRNGQWSPKTASLKVIVHPTLWRSDVAYVVYILIILTLIVLLYLSRQQKILRERSRVMAIEKSEARLRDVLWGSGDELWRWDLKTNLIARTNNSNHSKNTDEVLIHVDSLFAKTHPEDIEHVKIMLDQHIRGERDYYEAQFRLLDNKNNCWRWVLSRGRIIERDENGKPLLIAGTSKDINDIKKTEKQLRYLANYDQLTQLPNRSLFHEHLNHAIQMAKRFNDKIGLLFFDLDSFKLVNDLQGHAVGDQLLQGVAERLAAALRDTDNIARLGGDEFAIIVERISSAQEVVPTLERIMHALASPFEISFQSIKTSISIGVAIYPNDGDTPAILLKHADIAMYDAKRHGKNSYRFYKPSMNALLIKRIDIEKELSIAIKNNQFETFYQPRVCVQSNKIKGFEALLRWRHPDKGIISPIEFIPISEETGQILELGNWILDDSCKQAAIWQQAGWQGCISVNIAALQFKQADLVTRVEQVLKKYNLPAAFLELEITEGTLIKNIEHTRGVILGLKKLGIRIALDDFGTGYSSLSYLQQLPIDILKIDRSFIIQLTHSTKSSRLALAIINMAHSLDLEVVAEGIEEQAQLDFLKSTECEEYQGYLFGKPQTVSDIEKQLNLK